MPFGPIHIAHTVEVVEEILITKPEQLLGLR